MYRFLGRHAPETVALVAAAVIFLAGLYLSCSNDVVWLNRSGSLIIVVGVLLAASRFHEWVQQKVWGFVETNFESIANKAFATVQSEVRSLAANDQERIKSKLREELNKDLALIFEEDRRRIRAWEVFLIIFGTLLNGFGDYAASLLMTNGA